jgi:hypothetical protein
MTNRFGIYLCRGNCRGEEVVGKAIGLSWRSLIAADRVLPMLLVRQGEALAAGHLGMELCLGPRRNCFPLTGGTEGSNPSSSSGESVSAVNPGTVGEKPCSLAVVCGGRGRERGDVPAANQRS